MGNQRSEVSNRETFNDYGVKPVHYKRLIVEAGDTLNGDDIVYAHMKVCEVHKRTNIEVAFYIE